MSQVTSIRPQVGSGPLLEPSIDDFLAAADLAPTTVKHYRASLEALVVDLKEGIVIGEVSRGDIEDHLRVRYGRASAATYNRHLAAIRSLFVWAQRNELVAVSVAGPLRSKKSRRSKTAERQQRPIPYNELETLWADRSHRLWDRCYWAMAYDSAARAGELLGLNIEDLDIANK